MDALSTTYKIVNKNYSKTILVNTYGKGGGGLYKKSVLFCAYLSLLTLFFKKETILM